MVAQQLSLGYTTRVTRAWHEGSWCVHVELSLTLAVHCHVASQSVEAAGLLGLLALTGLSVNTDSILSQLYSMFRPT
jgi:hypothetical protein